MIAIPTSAARAAMRARSAGVGAVKTVARRFALDRQVDFWLRELNPAWSLKGPRARVVDVLEETHDVKTFVLLPNRRFPGYRAGQFVAVEVEVDGVRTARCYSFSSAPDGRECAITVKRVPGGRVSSWLHDHLKRGDVLALGSPAGDFVVPSPTPRKLLLMSGGSGVTPVMSILRDLAQKNQLSDVVFLHAARSARDVIFAAELEQLAAEHPGLRLGISLEHRTPLGGRLELGSFGGRLDRAKLWAIVPDLNERETFLCGPPGMLQALTPIWAGAGLGCRLKVERFAPAEPSASPAEAGRPQTRPSGPTERETTSPRTVTLLRSGRRVTTQGGRALLEELERAGEHPAYGCRMGVCNTCRCHKRAGIVENTLTGELSGAHDEEVRLCVSRARTDLELYL